LDEGIDGTLRYRRPVVHDGRARPASLLELERVAIGIGGCVFGLVLDRQPEHQHAGRRQNAIGMIQRQHRQGRRTGFGQRADRVAGKRPDGQWKFPAGERLADQAEFVARFVGFDDLDRKTGAVTFVRNAHTVDEREACAAIDAIGGRHEQRDARRPRADPLAILGRHAETLGTDSACRPLGERGECRRRHRSAGGPHEEAEAATARNGVKGHGEARMSEITESGREGRTGPEGFGTLYVVATPIGNLSDLSERMIRTLQAVDWVAAEDTRTTRVLLDRAGSSARMLAAHQHNERASADRILSLLTSGAQVALVSDAGTPAVSDPGCRVVSTVLDAGLTVVPIPGPSAAIAMVSASGLVDGPFHFEGFLPTR